MHPVRLAKEMATYRDEGIVTVAFGDLFLEDLRAWREANLARAGMRGIFPVWKRETNGFAREVIALGFRARLSQNGKGIEVSTIKKRRLSNRRFENRPN